MYSLHPNKNACSSGSISSDAVIMIIGVVNVKFLILFTISRPLNIWKINIDYINIIIIIY